MVIRTFKHFKRIYSFLSFLFSLDFCGGKWHIKHQSSFTPASEKLSVGTIGIIGSWLRQVRSPLVSLLVIEAKYLRKQLKEIKMYFTYDF